VRLAREAWEEKLSEYTKKAEHLPKAERHSYMQLETRNDPLLNAYEALREDERSWDTDNSKPDREWFLKIRAWEKRAILGDRPPKDSGTHSIGVGAVGILGCLALPSMKSILCIVEGSFALYLLVSLSLSKSAYGLFGFDDQELVVSIATLALGGLSVLMGASSLFSPKKKQS